jgi:CubicO group peptidase (beta-lactamase class C family)
MKLVASGFLLMASLSAAAQTSQSSEIDQLVRQDMAQKHVPGMVVAVMSNSNVLLLKGYGLTKLIDGTVPSADTIFHLGSVSKALTGFGMMKLVQDGKVDLDSPVSKYLTEIPKSWKAITVRQFMTHTSGIPDLAKGPTKKERTKEDWEDALDRVNTTPLKFAPGTQQEYKNGNYAVVGKIIEQVSGKTYLDFMKATVFQPFGMTHTGVGFKGTSVADGYQMQKATTVPVSPKFADYSIPAGGLQTSMNDLVQWEKGMIAGKVLTLATYKAMFTPSVPPGSIVGTHFTPGWESRYDGSEFIIEKTGGITGFESIIELAPNRGLAVMILQNGSGYGGAAGLANKIMKELGVGAAKHRRTQGRPPRIHSSRPPAIVSGIRRPRGG